MTTPERLLGIPADPYTPGSLIEDFISSPVTRAWKVK